MFLPKQILYEKNVKNYELGRELLEKYKDDIIRVKDITSWKTLAMCTSILCFQNYLFKKYLR